MPVRHDDLDKLYYDACALKRKSPGITYRDIAEALGTTRTRVETAMAPRRRRPDVAPDPNAGKRGARGSNVHGQSGLVERWQPKHGPRPIVGEPNPAVNSAAAAFARGEIDRNELLRRISGGALHSPSALDENGAGAVT